MTGVVKEIEIRLNDLSAAGKDIVCSARQSALVQVVVHPDTDPVHRTTADNVRDIGDNGEKAAFMPGDLNTVAEHNCTVGNASKTKLHLALHRFRHKKNPSDTRNRRSNPRSGPLVKKSEKLAGTGMEMGDGRPFFQFSARPQDLGSNWNCHIPSSDRAMR